MDEKEPHNPKRPRQPRASDVLSMPWRWVSRIDWKRWTGPGKFTAAEIFEHDQG